MALTYDPIATTTLGSAASSVTFSSISSAYTDLVLVIYANGSILADSWLRFNSDSGSNYSTTRLYGYNSSASSDRYSNSSQIIAGDLNTSSNTVTIMNIQNYSNSTTYKTVLLRNNVANSIVFANVGLWRNTSAINRIDFSPSGGTLSAGSTFTLYGIKAA